MNELATIVEAIITSQAAVAAVALAWVYTTYKTCSDDKKAQIEERRQWASRIDALALTLNEAVRAFERRD